ncbi:MAG: tetratricopeptide repeat protein [Gammaproteobacteria bacterium]|nr:tetratricopeptide repeat protein [Gammaproteobacteria bacterium]
MPLINQFPDEVLSFKMQHFHLKNDLAQLSKAYQYDIREATIFYSGRILEALSSHAVSALGGKAKANVFANLEYIDDFHFFNNSTRFWAHALRRLANQVRHLLSDLEHDAHHISVALLNNWIEWFFVDYPLGPKLSNFKTSDDSSIEVVQLINQLSRNLNQDSFDAIKFNQQHKELLLHPALISIIIEKLLDKGSFTEADQLIEQALERSPDDLRLRQLFGLSMSRQSKLEKAMNTLQQLNKSFPNDDETMGILGGLFKRVWSNTGDNTYLNRSGKLYQQGWKNSRERNTYLGINAASIKLWQGKLEETQAIAKSITEQFKVKQQILSDKLPNQQQSLNFWDKETLAQAYFLAGQSDEAFNLYKELLDPIQYPNKPFTVVTSQLRKHFQFIQPAENLKALIDAFE